VCVTPAIHVPEGSIRPGLQVHRRAHALHDIGRGDCRPGRIEVEVAQSRIVVGSHEEVVVPLGYLAAGIHGYARGSLAATGGGEVPQGWYGVVHGAGVAVVTRVVGPPAVVVACFYAV